MRAKNPTDAPEEEMQLLEHVHNSFEGASPPPYEQMEETAEPSKPSESPNEEQSNGVSESQHDCVKCIDKRLRRWLSDTQHNLRESITQRVYGLVSDTMYWFIHSNSLYLNKRVPQESHNAKALRKLSTTAKRVETCHRLCNSMPQIASRVKARIQAEWVVLHLTPQLETRTTYSYRELLDMEVTALQDRAVEASHHYWRVVRKVEVAIQEQEGVEQYGSKIGQKIRLSSEGYSPSLESMLRRARERIDVACNNVEDKMQLMRRARKDRKASIKEFIASEDRLTAYDKAMATGKIRRSAGRSLY